MAAVASLSPMVRAIYETLTGERVGGIAPIPPRRFARWTDRTLLEDADMGSLGGPPFKTQVLIAAIRPSEHVVRGDDGWEQRYEIRVQVGYAIQGGNYLDQSDVQGEPAGGDLTSITKRIAEDQRLIVASLEGRENLRRTKSGHDTGIISGLLDLQESTTTLFKTTAGAPSKYVATHLFVADVQLTRPA